MNNPQNEERALQALEEGRLRKKILFSCRYCGMTSQEFALQEAAEANEHLTRKTLEWLSKPNAMGFPALLNAMPMQLEGRKGRPQQAYFLTAFGASVLRRLDPNIRKARINTPAGKKDLTHRFAQLDLFSRARQNGWAAEIEKVIQYQGGEIRCDVLVHRPGDSDLYLEVEQELTRNNIERARGKFRNWQAYALEAGFVPDMFMVFNLKDRNLEPTLSAWREALACVSESDDFALDVRYVLIGALEGQPLGYALETYGAWMEPILPAENGAKTGSAASAPQQDGYDPDLLPEFEQRVTTLRFSQSDADRLRAFFGLMEFIHAASYGSVGDWRQGQGEVYRYSKLPERSLWLLRHYLRLPQNHAMYEDLKRAMTWLQSKSSMGLIMLRNAACNVLWDTFLQRHSLAMGGALRITLEVPDYVNLNSGFEVRAHMPDYADIFRTDNERDQACGALGWVMSAFFWYPEFLETGVRWEAPAKPTRLTGSGSVVCMPMRQVSCSSSSSYRSMWAEASMTAAGPFAVPLTYDVVASYGTGMTVTREVFGSACCKSVPP